MTVSTIKSSFRDYMDTQGEPPPDTVLGYIVWFSVGDAPYAPKVLIDGFDRLNLNTALLPAALRPDDAFEKAAKEVSGVKYAVGAVGEATAEVLVREVTRDSRTIIRQLTREIKDSRGKRLHYQPVGELVFYKAQATGGVVDPNTARVRATLESDPNILSPTERAVLMEKVINPFNASFDKHRLNHDGQKIRTLLREYVLFLNAVMCKPGVYFVHASRVAELRRLQEFTNGLGTSNLTLVPMLDLPHLREEIIDTFQREAVKELETVVSEIARLRATRKKLSAASFVKIKAEYDRVMKKAAEYGRTLTLSQEHTAGAAEVALDALIALQGDVYAAMEAS